MAVPRFDINDHADCFKNGAAMSAFVDEITEAIKDKYAIIEYSGTCIGMVVNPPECITLLSAKLSIALKDFDKDV